MGLLDSANLQDLGMAFGLLNARRGDNWPQLLVQAGQQRMLQQKLERENRSADLQQVVQTYKILKDQDQEARTNAMFTGQPYAPNPLLAQHEAKLAQLMNTPSMAGGAHATQQPSMPFSATAPNIPQAPSRPLSSGPPAPVPRASASAPQGTPQTQSEPTSIPEMLRGAGIDPRVAAAWAQTPTGKNELFKKLADVYGPRVVNNVLMQIQPNGQTRILGGAVSNDAIPVVTGPDGRPQIQQIPGLMDARADQKAAETRAVEGVKAPYNFGTYNTGPNGAPQVMSTARLMQLEGRGQPQPQIQPQSVGVAGLSVSQPPRPGSGASFGGGGLTGPDPVRVAADRTQAEDIAKFHAQNFVETQQAGKAAQKQAYLLDRTEQLMQGVETGKLTEWGMTGAAYARSFNIELDPKLPAKQAMQSLVGEMALQNRNPAGGAGMPGAMSDADREFLKNMSPNLAQTPEGRRLVVETKRKILQRDQEVAQLAREYRAKNNGRIDDGFAQTLQDYANSHPLFPQARPQQQPGVGWSIQEVPN